MARLKPGFCPEEGCRCITHSAWKGGKEYVATESFFCIGKASTDHIFTYQGEKHHNTHFFCIWTPLKGWAKFQIDSGDMTLIMRCMGHALADKSKSGHGYRDKKFVGVNPNWMYGRDLDDDIS